MPNRFLNSPTTILMQDSDSSTAGCAKTPQSAHPEMLQHVWMRKNA